MTENCSLKNILALLRYIKMGPIDSFRYTGPVDGVDYKVYMDNSTQVHSDRYAFIYSRLCGF